MSEKAFHELSVDELIKWVPFFLVEIRTAQKRRYRALSYLEFVTCLQCSCAVHNVTYKFLHKDRFAPIKNALNNIMQVRQRSGLGNNPRKAELVTYESEESLFFNGILGGDN